MTRWVVLLTLVVFATTACDGNSAGGSSEEVGTVPEPGTTMFDNTQTTIDELRAAVDVLASLDLELAFGQAEVTTCEDFARQWEPYAWAHLERGGRPSTAADVERVRQALVDDGWVDEANRFPTGPVGEERWIVTLRRGDVELTINLWADESYVIVSAGGVCLPATAAQREHYEKVLAWDLDEEIPAELRRVPGT